MERKSSETKQDQRQVLFERKRSEAREFIPFHGR